MERIGVLGGTFDPPHIGHLWLAENARQELFLDRVLFVPAGLPPHKKGYLVSASKHRLAMAELATAENGHFRVNHMDSNRPAPHFTVTLLPLLREAYANADFWLLIGSDSLNDLPNWHQPRRLFGQCRLAVLPRPGYSVDWVTLSLSVPGVDAATDILRGPSIDLSATGIRRLISSGRSTRYLVPPPVMEYITREKMYQ